MNELTVGQKVICKHKNGRYYQCDVVQLSKETFYEVNFDDIVVFTSLYRHISLCSCQIHPFPGV